MLCKALHGPFSRPGTIFAHHYAGKKYVSLGDTLMNPPSVTRPSASSTSGNPCAGTGRLEIEALYEIAKLVGSALDLDRTLSRILRILHEVLRMERSTLVLVDETGRRLAIRASYGLSNDERKRGVYGFGEGVIGTVFRTASPFIVPDIKSEPLFLDRTGARTRFSKEQISFIGVPVIVRQEPAGVLTVDRLFGPEVSLEEDVRFLSIVSALIAQFLELHKAIRLKEEDILEENRSLRAELGSRFATRNIIGDSKAIHDVLVLASKVASTSAAVLVLGESGTGKELIARAIHQMSPRKDRPFIKINCAAIPETLLESELFGHEKGAFTGAAGLKKGRFEQADTGTIFLDEIGELPLALQAKLLRVLQEQEFERLGGTETLQTDVRVIAATNRRLEEAVQRGMFRADLYYRLNVVPILIPALRERREDIPPLIDHFLRESNHRNHRSLRFSREALEALFSYEFPGNVRELQNVIERLVIVTGGDVIGIDDLPAYIHHAPAAPCTEAPERERKGRSLAPRRPLEEMEREALTEALSRHAWIRSRAARELGLTQRQIGYKIKKHGLKPPEDEEVSSEAS